MLRGKCLIHVAWICFRMVFGCVIFFHLQFYFKRCNTLMGGNLLYGATSNMIKHQYIMYICEPMFLDHFSKMQLICLCVLLHFRLLAKSTHPCSITEFLQFSLALVLSLSVSLSLSSQPLWYPAIRLGKRWPFGLTIFDINRNINRLIHLIWNDSIRFDTLV